MLLDALFDPFGIAVLVCVLLMLAASAAWYRAGRGALDRLATSLDVLRRVAGELRDDHPIRRRLESAPVAELSFEEIARLLEGESKIHADAHALIDLRARTAWMERFGQFAVHLGILGTVFALVGSDPSDLDAFRTRLPLALGTTFWGLVGALGLSVIAGAAESLLDRATLRVRQALLAGFEPEKRT